MSDFNPDLSPIPGLITNFKYPKINDNPSIKRLLHCLKTSLQSGLGSLYAIHHNVMLYVDRWKKGIKVQVINYTTETVPEFEDLKEQMKDRSVIQSLEHAIQGLDPNLTKVELKEIIMGQNHVLFTICYYTRRRFQWF